MFDSGLSYVEWGRSTSRLFHLLWNRLLSRNIWLLASVRFGEMADISGCRHSPDVSVGKLKSLRVTSMLQRHTRCLAGLCGVVLHRGTVTGRPRFDSAQGTSGDGRTPHRSPGETEPAMQPRKRPSRDTQRSVVGGRS